MLASNSSFAGGLKAGTTWHLEGGSAGDVDCGSSTLNGTIGTNPSTPSVTGSLWPPPAFANCTDTMPFVTVTGVSTPPAAKTLSFTYVAPPGKSSFAIAGVVVTITLSDGSTCTYAPTLGSATATHNSGTSPWNNEYAFDNVPMTKTGGASAFCPSLNVTLSATYVLTSGGAGITIQV